MLENTKLTKPDEMIFSLFRMSLRADLDINKDQYGNYILRFNANKTHYGVEEELLDQLNDWYNMAQKERAGAITNEELIDWMLKYPFGPNTHYEEIFKITGQPCDYESADQFFHKAKIHRYMEYTDE